MEAAGWHEVGDGDAEVDGGRKRCDALERNTRVKDRGTRAVVGWSDLLCFCGFSNI
jgi:hypothetical protein